MVHLDKVCLLLLGPEVGLEGGHVGDELNLLSAGVHRLPARVDNQRHRLRQLLRFWNINLDKYKTILKLTLSSLYAYKKPTKIETYTVRDVDSIGSPSFRQPGSVLWIRSDPLNLLHNSGSVKRNRKSTCFPSKSRSPLNPWFGYGWR